MTQKHPPLTAEALDKIFAEMGKIPASSVTTSCLPDTFEDCYGRIWTKISPVEKPELPSADIQD